MKAPNSGTTRRALALASALAACVVPRTAVASYAFEGQGIANVLAGSVANGGLFWATVPTWPTGPHSLPYTNEVAFVLPACDRVVASRLIMTIWGGTPDYTCQVTVTVNGTNLPTTP